MFSKLNADEIRAALQGTTRQYLVGKLKLPQALAHIDDSNIETGVTSYKEYTIEPPHTHKAAFEYQYMISGETKYLNIDTGAETKYASGDFYRIEPGTRYAQKSVGGTTILFIKTPPGNDKIAVESSEATEQWFAKWD
jgi:quercetin dioxygenase-like cupin family protein